MASEPSEYVSLRKENMTEQTDSAQGELSQPVDVPAVSVQTSTEQLQATGPFRACSPEKLHVEAMLRSLLRRSPIPLLLPSCLICIPMEPALAFPVAAPLAPVRRLRSGPSSRLHTPAGRTMVNRHL